MAACDDSGADITRSQATAAADAGTADAFELVGGTWEPPGTPEEFLDPTLNDRCIRLGTGLGASDDGLLTEQVSAPFFGWSDPRGVGGNVRTAIRVYENSAAAEAAIEHVDAAAFERCLITTTNRYLELPKFDYAFSIDAVEDATAESFKTKAYPSSSAQSMIAASRFEAEVIGGFDNTSIAGICVARSGPVVVAAMSIGGGQLMEPRDDATIARGAEQLCSAALTRAVEASRTT